MTLNENIPDHPLPSSWYYRHEPLCPVFFLIRLYSLYGGGFIVTIPVRLILYINYISPLSPSPHHLKVIARDFFVLFHIGI
jgi:hypothetical protein